MSKIKLLYYIFKVSFFESKKLSFTPEDERKNASLIFVDLFLFAIKHKSFNRNYFVCGRDKKGAQQLRFSHKQIARTRNMMNARAGNTYVGALEDKLHFFFLCRSAGIRTPHVYFANTGSGLINVSEPQSCEKVFLKELKGIKGSALGKSLFLNGKYEYNDEILNVDQLDLRLGTSYIAQEQILQHPELSSLNDTSINTLRIVTHLTRDGSTAEACFAFLKIGAPGAIVNNWASGGLIVNINLIEGVTDGYGCYKYRSFSPNGSGYVTQLPNGRSISNFEIPYYNDAISLVTEAHTKLFYSFHSIGWDGAITPEGPVLIEGNHDWDVSFIQVLIGDNGFGKIFPSLSN